MSGETNLNKLVKQMTPKLNPGQYVFLTVESLDGIDRTDTICEFREAEGTTIIMKKQKADQLGFGYDFVAAWITLSVHSALEAVGLTALFSTELAKHNISCNVVAGYYHDHIFVSHEKRKKALEVLNALSES